MLFVDVNLGNNGTQRIVIYEGDTAERLATKFSAVHNLDDTMKGRLVIMLEQQMAAVLTKIDEDSEVEDDQNDSQEDEEPEEKHEEPKVEIAEQKEEEKEVVEEEHHQVEQH